MRIGLAAAMFVLLNGCRTGISGILRGLLRPVRGAVGWRIAFVRGRVGAPRVCHRPCVMPPLRFPKTPIHVVTAFMGGAIAAGAAAFALRRRSNLSILGAEMKLPSARHIDRLLVVSSVLLGIGWDVTFYPGPGWVALGMGQNKAVVSVAPMRRGVDIFEWAERRKQTPELGAVGKL